MRHLSRPIGHLAACVFLFAAASVHAQATRTWVSGVGDDANPCSRTAPCKTFAGAISKTAVAGVISVLDPGGFGAVTITKSITIDGGGIEGSILAASSSGISISAAATDQVVLRNLTIYGVSPAVSGIRVNSADKVVIEHVDISGFDYAVYILGTGQVNVLDSYLHDNRQYGILMSVSTGRLMVDQSQILDNGYYGVRIEGPAVSSVRRSTFSGNGVMGISANGSGFLSVDDCLVSHSSYGIGSGDRATVSVSNTTVANTTVRALFDGGGPLLTYGNNRLSGNAVDGAFNGTVSLR